MSYGYFEEDYFKLNKKSNFLLKFKLILILIGNVLNISFLK